MSLITIICPNTTKAVRLIFIYLKWYNILIVQSRSEDMRSILELARFWEVYFYEKLKAKKTE